jgi:UDP-glucose 4-epimerase
MSKENVLVLGGSVFLGSHVVDTLDKAGFQVKIFDINPSPYLSGTQEMIVGNIMDLDAVVNAARGCRYVYNFAGLADIDKAKDYPIIATECNVLGNAHALEAARLAKVERFILASSVYVYSDVGSFYSASKQAAERFAEAYHERYGLNYTILRYGSLYGRRSDERNGIYRFLRQALEQGAVTYKGKPEAMREYIHVADAARLSVQILQEQYANGHYILTGHERMSVKNLLKMISEMMPNDIDIKFDDQVAHGHYEMTPYAFHPRLGLKLTGNCYIDLGQGLLDCLAELQENKYEQLPDKNLLVED